MLCSKFNVQGQNSKQGIVNIPRIVSSWQYLCEIKNAVKINVINRRCLLLFTRIKPVACVLIRARVIARIKWRRRLISFSSGPPPRLCLGSIEGITLASKPPAVNSLPQKLQVWPCKHNDNVSIITDLFLISLLIV